MRKPSVVSMACYNKIVRRKWERTKKDPNLVFSKAPYGKVIQHLASGMGLRDFLSACNSMGIFARFNGGCALYDDDHVLLYRIDIQYGAGLWDFVLQAPALLKQGSLYFELSVRRQPGSLTYDLREALTQQFHHMLQTAGAVYESA